MNVSLVNMGIIRGYEKANFYYDIDLFYNLLWTGEGGKINEN